MQSAGGDRDPERGAEGPYSDPKFGLRVPIVQYTVENLPRSVRGTGKTIKRMHLLVAKGKLHPTMQKIASWIRLRVPADLKAKSRELADEVFWWVKRHGIFQRDPHQIEKIEHPVESMRPVIEARKRGIYSGPGLFIGDCDTYAIWVATLGGILGYPYSFETVKVDPARPDEFSHVYTALWVDGRWVAYDASTPDAVPGWRPPVDSKMFRRWPEDLIEKTMGLNGHPGAGGMGYWPDEPGYYPWDYVQYSIPKTTMRGPNVIPEVNFGRRHEFGVHIPREPAEPKGEMEAKTRYVRKRRKPEPHERDKMIESHDYFPRPHYEPKKPYIHVRSPYHPAWPWARQMRVFMGSPKSEVKIRGRQREIIRRPIPVPPGGYEGLGQEVMVRYVSVGKIPETEAARVRDAMSKAGLNPRFLPPRDGKIEIEVPESQASAARSILQGIQKDFVAQESVWETVSKTFQKLIADAPEYLKERYRKKQQEYRSRIAAAQARVAEARAREAEMLARAAGGVERRWYESPWVWVAGGALVLGTGYLMLKRS